MEDNEPALYVEIVTRERYGMRRDFVAYRIEGESRPFGEVPYEAHRSYNADINTLVREAIRAGKRSVNEPN